MKCKDNYEEKNRMVRDNISSEWININQRINWVN